MLRVHVERRHRAGRRDEDEALVGQHLAGRRFDHRGDLAEHRLEQRRIGRHPLDMLQHHPAAAFLDPADRLLDRQAGRADRAGIDPDRQVARIIFDAGRRHLPPQLDQRLERQQFVPDEPVIQQARLTRIEGSQAGKIGFAEDGHRGSFALSTAGSAKWYSVGYRAPSRVAAVSIRVTAGRFPC